MKGILFFVLFLCLGITSYAETTWLTDLTVAQDQAKQESKCILVNFTGSDWCPWCIKLDKEIFETEQFSDFAKEHLVLVKLDYPRHNNQDPEVRAANARLKGKYIITGFPTIILLNKDGKETTRRIGGASTLESFMQWLEINTSNKKDTQTKKD